MRNGAASRAVRIALALLLGAGFARTGSASDVEIPQKLLDYEARVKASMTPDAKARAAALEARVSSKMSVHDVMALGGPGGTSDEMILCLMSYLKDCAKEIKANRMLKEELMRKSLAAKASKLEQDNARIAAAMQEAKQKAQNLMDAARTGMVTGIVSGAVQTGGAAASFAGFAGAGASTTKTPTRVPTRAVVPPPDDFRSGRPEVTAG